MCFEVLILAEFMVTCQILALHLTVFCLFMPHLPRHPEDAQYNKLVTFHFGTACSLPVSVSGRSGNRCVLSAY